MSRIAQVLFRLLPIVVAGVLMPFTRKALALVWLIVLGLFVLSASGILMGRNALWLVIGGLMTRRLS